MRIAVAGGTGRLGRNVVEIGVEQGHEMVSISRSEGVDVITGAGLDEALAGVEVIIDAATGPSPEQQPATDFFVTAAQHLQEVGQRNGVPRAVVVSIIGTDNFRGGYGFAKIAHEDAWRSGPIPASVVRAAQFHEFVGQVLDWGGEGDVARVPAMLTQIVAARTVAEVLVDLATAPTFRPDQPVEVAGPRQETLLDLAVLLAARRGAPLKVESVLDPDDPDARMQATGGLLPGPDALLGGPTYGAWLDVQ